MDPSSLPLIDPSMGLFCLDHPVYKWTFDGPIDGSILFTFDGLVRVDFRWVEGPGLSYESPIDDHLLMDNKLQLELIVMIMAMHLIQAMFDFML